MIFICFTTIIMSIHTLKSEVINLLVNKKYIFTIKIYL